MTRKAFKRGRKKNTVRQLRKRGFLAEVGGLSKPGETIQKFAIGGIFEQWGESNAQIMKQVDLNLHMSACKIGKDPIILSEFDVAVIDYGLDDPDGPPIREHAEALGLWLIDCIRSRDVGALRSASDLVARMDSSEDTFRLTALRQFHNLSKELGNAPSLIQLRNRLRDLDARKSLLKKGVEAPSKEQLQKEISHHGWSKISQFDKMAKTPPFDSLERSG